MHHTLEQCRGSPRGEESNVISIKRLLRRGSTYPARRSVLPIDSIRDVRFAFVFSPFHLTFGWCVYYNKKVGAAQVVSLTIIFVPLADHCNISRVHAEDQGVKARLNRGETAQTRLYHSQRSSLTAHYIESALISYQFSFSRHVRIQLTEQSPSAHMCPTWLGHLRLA